MGARTHGQRRSGGIPLQKRYGQHHLRSGMLCRPLIEFLRPAGQVVVEIGPGGGVLSEQLVEAGARVIAVEIDLAWAASLQSRRLASTRVVVTDALELEWTRLPAPTLVAGNLPFNIATVLIDRVLDHRDRVPRAAFMVQKEVGDRLLALPGSAAYGAMSVLVSARAAIHNLGIVKRGSFRPAPKVDAMFVGFELHAVPLNRAAGDGWSETVYLAFSQRRKQLRNALAAGWGRDRAEQALDGAGIEPTARAEELSLDDFLRLHKADRERRGSPSSVDTR